MKPDSRYTVALVDWTWTGHHSTYFKFYAAALADLGVCVAPFLPYPDELPELLRSTPVANSPAALTRIAAPSTFRAGMRWPIRPRSLQRFQQQSLHFRTLGRQLRQWEKANRARIDLLFFNTIYELDFDWFGSLGAVCPYPWSGLHVHARPLEPGTDKSLPSRYAWPASDTLTSRRLKAIAILDPNADREMRRRARGKPTVVFPDIADTTVPGEIDAAAGLAAKIKTFAAGRPIVSVLGHLKRSKGLEAFTAAAEDPRLREVFFFLGGEVGWDSFPRDVQNRLRSSWESAPNIYAHLQRIEEQSFNAVVRTSDVVYAAYLDFPFSSNILTKAAVFRKPLIVSDGHLMAERTRSFSLGRVVRQGNSEDVVQAILASVHRSAEPPQPDARWADYAALHSYERLRGAFAELLSHAGCQPSPRASGRDDGHHEEI